MINYRRFYYALLYPSYPSMLKDIRPLVQVLNYITNERKVDDDDEKQKQPDIHLLKLVFYRP